MTYKTQVEIDHFVIAATSLETGVNHIEKKLGVTMPFGGTHLKMGTHNHLMRIAESVFLEVIAINTDIKPERTPRWFDLDNPQMQNHISQEPKLITWVIRTNNIEKTVKTANIPINNIETVSRGNLTWKITVPKDGSLREDGLFPTFIQWPDDVKPWENMKDLGIRFEQATLKHPAPENLQKSIENIGISDTRISFKKSENKYIKLELQKPNNEKIII